ncbi:hypothetical protein GRAQ_04791 [Rahnella aquatilis CIP 78.65 = ATCC 33071]|uniref:hypothetical protein n=1 Tax=Rahnella aquatilis TaxID=34038 RepID=UPI0003165C95|nr:hypothetical protein GRAQ_04791 [Rahnella aquatilis CIP 78.65 = ATCC 33071]
MTFLIIGRPFSIEKVSHIVDIPHFVGDPRTLISQIMADLINNLLAGSFSIYTVSTCSHKL